MSGLGEWDVDVDDHEEPRPPSPATGGAEEALWRAWEHLRLDPATGMSVWLRDHADHHLGVLFSEHGPFAKATDESSHGTPLPYTPPPEGLFPDVRG